MADLWKSRPEPRSPILNTQYNYQEDKVYSGELYSYRTDKRSSSHTDAVKGDSATTVADHYNKLKARNLGERDSSSIIGLRKYNNWLKSVLAQQTTESLKSLYASSHLLSVSTSPENLRVLDICCGKGGDIKKWLYAGVNTYVGIDIAEQSVIEAERRLNEMLESSFHFQKMISRKNSTFKSKFIALDCFNHVIDETVLTDAFYPNHFHVVSCMFAIHYAFENVFTAERAFKNASDNLQKGGFFVFTTPSHEHLETLKKKAFPDTTYSNSIFQVEFLPSDTNTTTDATTLPTSRPLSETVPRLENIKYKFYLDEAVHGCPEFSIPFPFLRTLLENFGFELRYKRSFAEFYFDFKDVPFAVDLLHNFRILPTTYRGDRAQRHLDLTYDEAEVVQIYDVFILQKTGTYQ